MSATAASGAAAPPLEARQWRQLGWITAGAIVIFTVLRLLPTGTNLSHMDFRVEARGTNTIEFCDPVNPQFIPVVAARSPVAMTVIPLGPVVMGRELHAAIKLSTGSGKPVGPEDLLVVHTRKLHLLIVDPTLTDYQHVHPEPARQRGEWTFAFQPRTSGTYRIFADFTPVATARGLYASVDMVVGESSPSAVAATTRGSRGSISVVERDGFRFTLTTTKTPVRTGQPIDLHFSIVKDEGGAVPLGPVMGAFAHLVAFDEARSGFAHLHPMETDLARPPDGSHPALNFKLTIPRPGHYVVWAQINLAGRETFVPFALEVVD